MDTEQTTETGETATGKLKEKLKQHLEGARVRLEELKRAIGSLRAGDRRELEKKIDEVHKRVDAQQARADELRSEKATHAREKLSAIVEADREQLEQHAEQAEAFAINAVMVAMMDADEVEVAVLDALIAREALDAFLEAEDSAETAAPPPP